ncbi:MAG: nucleotide triphosphate diphosphatase NUDT15 [Gemmatimonas sp.]|uniref:nucleotide triphosphate diphosphatase NUDT15 n=1 Tax=Gemmatimonas sp. TaxID=1962908 RepID=UPI00391FC60C|nr:NUDIX hydrolase [Gemmatimonadota bacterium]
MTQRPSVGVAVLVFRDDRVLLGRRRGAHGDGTWQCPGGHLEWGETVEACAEREVLEETGLVINGTRPGPFTNDVFEAEAKHYVTLFMLADHLTGEPEVREPEKCERWDWFAWDALPEPLFLPLQHLRETGWCPPGATAR